MIIIVNIIGLDLREVTRNMTDAGDTVTIIMTDAHVSKAVVHHLPLEAVGPPPLLVTERSKNSSAKDVPPPLAAMCTPTFKRRKPQKSFFSK